MSLHNEELLNERTNISIVLELEAWQFQDKNVEELSVQKVRVNEAALPHTGGST